MVKSDSQLKQDIEDELFWDPRLNAASVVVAVRDGAVTLHGTVDTFADGQAAALATKRVGGVRAVSLDLSVRLLPQHRPSDGELTAAATSALAWDVTVPGSVTATVCDGALTLAGRVAWNFQREACERAVSRLVGVVAVNDDITLEEQPPAEQVRQKVQAALQRQSNRDPRSIRIGNCAGRVTLSGHVSSWQSLDDAAGAAWSAPGVTEVIDELVMDIEVRRDQGAADATAANG